MKPINSKERSKQVWQFIFIFFALAVVPLAIIFYSYYKVPEKLSDIEQRKLMNYSNFERSQKVLIRHLSEIDSNLNMLANETSNELPEVINMRIGKSLEDIKDADTSRLVSMISSAYNNHLKHVNTLIKARNELKNTGTDTKEMQKQLEDCKQTIQMLQMRSASPMP